MVLYKNILSFYGLLLANFSYVTIVLKYVIIKTFNVMCELPTYEF